MVPAMKVLVGVGICTCLMVPSTSKKCPQNLLGGGGGGDEHSQGGTCLMTHSTSHISIMSQNVPPPSIH